MPGFRDYHPAQFFILLFGKIKFNQKIYDGKSQAQHTKTNQESDESGNFHPSPNADITMANPVTSIQEQVNQEKQKNGKTTVLTLFLNAN